MRFVLYLPPLLLSVVFLALMGLPGAAQTFPLSLTVAHPTLASNARTYDHPAGTRPIELREESGIRLLALASFERPAAIEWPTGPHTPYRITRFTGGFRPTALNRWGQVVGNGPIFTPPYLYSNGRIVPLPLFGNNALSSAQDINDRAQILGYSYLHPDCANEFTTPIIWTPSASGRYRVSNLVSHHCDSILSATAINNEGIEIGDEAASGFNTDAVMFKNGDVSVVHHHNGFPAGASAINDEEQIVGSLDVDNVGNSVPFIAPAAAHCCGLYQYGYANDINERGHVVGSSWFIPRPSVGNDSAYFYANGKNYAIGTLPGGHYSDAIAVNDSDVVIGDAGSADPLIKQHAFVWRAGKITDLNQLMPPNFPYILYHAIDINDSGQILVNSVAKTNPKRESCSFLITPRD